MNIFTLITVISLAEILEKKKHHSIGQDLHKRLFMSSLVCIGKTLAIA